MRLVRHFLQTLNLFELLLRGSRSTMINFPVMKDRLLQIYNKLLVSSMS